MFDAASLPYIGCTMASTTGDAAHAPGHYFAIASVNVGLRTNAFTESDPGHGPGGSDPAGTDGSGSSRSTNFPMDSDSINFVLAMMPAILTNKAREAYSVTAPRIALDGQPYSYSSFAKWYGRSAAWRCWQEAERITDPRFLVASICRDGHICGYDGSKLCDSARVMVVASRHPSRLELHHVDYFHGVISGIPVCQTVVGEIDISACEMIAWDWGPAVRSFVLLKRRWRRCKWKKHIQSLCFPPEPSWFVHVARFL